MPDPKDRIDISEKVIIPLIGIIVSLVTAFLAFTISEKQYQISEKQNQIQVDLKDIQTSQFGRELQQKYIEIFYTEIASGNAKRQDIALDLVLLIEPDVGKKPEVLNGRKKLEKKPLNW